MCWASPPAGTTRGADAGRRRGALRDRELLKRIRSSYESSGGTYGIPRIHADLRADGIQVGRKRVARLMRAAGWVDASRRKKAPRTTQRDASRRPAPDLVERDFTADGRDRLWVADITYVPTQAGYLYLAVVLEAWSRRFVGWAIETHMRTELALEALDMALWQRRPAGVIHLSNQGSQYSSLAFGKRCREARVRPSTGSVGDCYDKTPCARASSPPWSAKLLDRADFPTRAEARRKVFQFLEGWYNPHRHHSALGLVSPVAFERHRATAALPVAA